MLLPLYGLAQVNWFEKAKTSYIVDSSLRYAELHYANIKDKERSKDAVLTICYLAKQLVVKSKYTRAEKLLSEAKQWAYVKTNSEAQARIALELANLHKYRADYGAALEFYLSALDLTRQTGNRALEVTVQVDIAEYYRRIGKFGLARNRIQDAHSAYNQFELRDSTILIRIHHRAAAIANEMNDIRGSIRLSQTALEMARSAHYPYSQGVSLNELGFSFKNLHRYDTAETLYKEAEEIWFKLGAQREAVNAMNNRAMLYAHASYPRKDVFKLYHAIIDTVTKNNIDFPLTPVYQYLHLTHSALGDSAAAYRYLVKYHHAQMEQERLRHDIQVTNITEQYEAEKAKQEMRVVASELESSKETLEKKRMENNRIYISLAVVGFLLFLIAFLAYKLNKSNKTLLARNKEKDTLLQEIHHRVKNNLQIISSLLELQTRKTHDPSTISIMQEGQNRVKAMSLIHKKLYQNEDLARVEFQAYLDDLTATLYQVFNSNNRNIQHQIKAKDIYFDIDTAIPLGLIINELVTNAYKYAFDQVSDPLLRIQINAIGQGEYELLVSDNGPGLPPDFDIQKVKSLGLRLVSRLTKQLLGSMNYERDGNINTFAITFKDTVTRKAVE